MIAGNDDSPSVAIRAGTGRVAGAVRSTHGVEPVVSHDMVLLAPQTEPPVFFAALAIIAVVSTGLVLGLRDWPARRP